MKDYVKFLKARDVLLDHPYNCGDGCCTWSDWYSEWVEVGEELWHGRVDFSDLEEGVDYIFTD